MQDVVGLRGVDGAQFLLDRFSCPLNPDIERFAHERAIEFARKGIAQTHLVIASAGGENRLAGFYSLANKVLSVPLAGAT